MDTSLAQRDRWSRGEHFSYDHGVFKVRVPHGRCRHGGRRGSCANPVEFILRYAYHLANGRSVRQAHRACRQHAETFARRNGVSVPP